ncbi:unnamed protein product, partial [Candidula unifasciata]
MMMMFAFVYTAFVFGVLKMTAAQLRCPYEGCVCERNLISCAAQNWRTLPKPLVSHVDDMEYLDLQ